jgi:peptidoglycan/LPS O-acetylase OafA/YrhL
LIIVGLAGIVGTLAFLQNSLGATAYWYGSSGWGFIPLRTLKPLIALFAAILLLGVCFHENLVTKMLELRPVKYLGVVSYGVYLWHLPMAKAIGAALPTKEHALRSFGLALVFVFLLALGWAALSHRFIESPFIGRPGPRNASDATVSTDPVPDRQIAAEGDQLSRTQLADAGLAAELIAIERDGTHA